MKIRFYLLLLLIWVTSNEIGAQQIYKTVTGDIAVSINYGDTFQLMVSHDLLVLLDYETSKLTFRVPYETFTTGIDSIDTKLRAIKGAYIEFAGKLSITINTRRFDQQKYKLEGVLTSTTPPLVTFGTGSMTCMAPANSTTPACTLLLSLESTLSALNLTDVFPGAKDAVRLDLRQSILERQSQ